MAWQEATIYPKISLNNVLSKSGKWIEPKPDNAYRLLTVRMWGKGVVERGVLNGSEMSAKRMIVVCPQQFIISRIDARNGASGLIPTDCDGAIVTNDFPVYDTDLSKLLPQYLEWLSKTSHFIELCKLASEGTTNRVRLKEDAFLKITIPLPPLEEQRRIVVRIEELAGDIAEARGLRARSIEECGSILGQVQAKLFSECINIVKIGDISTVIDPNPSHRYPMYMDEGVPIISTVDFVGENEINIKNTKLVPNSFFENTIGKFGVKEEDIVFSRKGKIGYARPYPANVKLAMTHTLCVIQPDRSKVIPKYLLHCTRSQNFIRYLTDTMNPNSGVPTLGLGIIRSASVPVPPLPEQRRIVTNLDDLQAKVDALKRLQAETAAELDALLPSILDKAFKGEL